MKLPNAPAQYSQSNEQQTRDALERADATVLRSDRDVELAGSVKIIVRATDTGARYSLTVSGGALVVTAL